MILGSLEIDVHSTHFKANTSMATLPNSTWEPTNDSTKENERGEETKQLDDRADGKNNSGAVIFF